MSVATDPLSKIAELDAAKVHNAPGNRAVTQEAVGQLLPSIEKDGQILPGIVYPHTTLPDAWYCADGCHRLAACRWLGRTFKAIVLQEAPSPDELARLRVAVNFLAKRASAYELAPEIQGWMDRNSASQKQAADFFRLSESTICKMMLKWRNAAPAVMQAEKEGLISDDTGRLLSTLPKGQQEAALKYVLANKLTRDETQPYVAGLRGFRRSKESKPVSVTDGGATIRLPASWTWQKIIDLATKLQDAAKRGIKVDGLTIAALPGLLKGPA